MWDRFIWFRIGTTGWLLWTRSWTFAYHTKHWISQAKQLYDSFKNDCAEQTSFPHTTCSANKCNDKRRVAAPSSLMASEQHKHNPYRTATTPWMLCISYHARIPISDKYSHWAALYSCHCAHIGSTPTRTAPRILNHSTAARRSSPPTDGLISGNRTAVTADMGMVRLNGGLEAVHNRKVFPLTGNRTQLTWTQRVSYWGTCWTTRRCSGRRLPAFATKPIAILLNTEAICYSETSTHIYKTTWRHNVFNKRPDRGYGMHGACGPANDLRARVHSVAFQQNWRAAE
jgi:hypothetical protein